MAASTAANAQRLCAPTGSAAAQNGDAHRRESAIVVGAACGKQFRLGKKIRSGSFGTVFVGTFVSLRCHGQETSGQGGKKNAADAAFVANKGTNLETGETVAVKVEPTRTGHPQLLYESTVLQALRGSLGVPAVRWCGRQALAEHFKCDNGADFEYNIMVVDLLGPSLEDLFHMCGKRFSPRTVLALALQMITLIETVHKRRFLHRDIKPDNFLMGMGQRCNVVHIVDFGLSKEYQLPGTAKHIDYREGKSLTGTARYASINTHRGYEQSRRDDMESLCYVLLYFLRGSLPWQGLSAPNKKQKYALILEKKLKTTTEVLCRGFPVEFCMFLNYCRQLRFDETPDYHYLRTLFRDATQRLGYPVEHRFDWELGFQANTIERPLATYQATSKGRFADYCNPPAAAHLQPRPSAVHLPGEMSVAIRSPPAVGPPIGGNAGHPFIGRNRNR